VKGGSPHILAERFSKKDETNSKKKKALLRGGSWGELFN